MSLAKTTVGRVQGQGILRIHNNTCLALERSILPLRPIEVDHSTCRLTPTVSMDSKPCAYGGIAAVSLHWQTIYDGIQETRFTTRGIAFTHLLSRSITRQRILWTRGDNK